MPEHAEKKIEKVEEVYAASLIELAESAGQLDAVAADVSELADLIRDQPGLLDLLSSRFIPTGERTGIIERLFKGQVHDLLYQFLQVVNRKDRAGHLTGICRAFAKLLKAHRGIVDVEAQVPAAMSAQEHDELAAGLGRAMGKTVQLDTQVNPALIGGLKIRVGDRMIDGSVATQLRLLRTRIQAKGRERARTQTDQMTTD